MASFDREQADQLKSLVADLEERRQNLRLFDGTEEINSHCDDLIGQVTLTVESAMDHLNKVQDRMINEINQHRKQLLDTLDSSRNDQAQSSAEKGLMNLSNELEIIKSNKLPHDEALEQAKSLLDKANDLRKQMRAKTFGGEFLRLMGGSFMDDDIIGVLEKTKKDAQDDFAIKHVVLDEMSLLPQAIDFDLESRRADVTAILLLRNGNLAVGFVCDPIIIWDPKEHKQLCQIKVKLEEEDHVTALAELPNGLLAIGSSHGRIVVWNLKAKRSKFELKCQYGSVLWLKASPDGKLVALGEEVSVWDLSDANEIPESPETRLETHELDWFLSCQEVAAWNSVKPANEALLSKEITYSYNHYDETYDNGYDRYGDMRDVSLQVHMELLWNGNLAFSYLLPSGPAVIVFDPSEDEIIHEINLEARNAESCTILPNGDVVLCHADNNVEIYSLEDQEVHTSFKNNKGPIVAIRMQANHSLTFVHLNEPKLRARTDKKRSNRRPNQLKAASTCFSDDGKYFAMGSSQEQVTIWPIQN